MKEYRVLIRVSAENESDLVEQLEALDGFIDSDLEWFCVARTDIKNPYRAGHKKL
jgi:hypothetical protein